MIWNANFLKKRQWQMAFFEMIDPKTVTQENYQLFIKFIDETESIDKKDIFNEKNVNRETIDLLCYFYKHYWSK